MPLGNTRNTAHKDVYSAARLYDIAFDFKDLKSDCDFFEEILAGCSTLSSSRSYLEFAAGPALHCIEMAKRGFNATAVDISPEMKAYGLEKAKQQGVGITYINSDMIDYSSEEKFDIASILMDSISYVLTNEDLINHLKKAASCLKDGGIYIIEMAHQRTFLILKKQRWMNGKLKGTDAK